MSVCVSSLSLDEKGGDRRPKERFHKHQGVVYTSPGSDPINQR